MVSVKSYMFQASILVVLLCMTPSNAGVPSDNINAICTKTKIPSYCLDLLGSTPGAATADLKGLAKITFNLAQSNAAKTLDQLNSLIPKTTDPKLLESYKASSKHLEDAIDSLKDSETDFNEGDYSGMNVQASAAMTNAGDCDDEIKDLAVDPSIKKAIQELDNICRIILAVSNLV